MSKITVVSILSAIAMFSLIVIGGYVRALGAGMGCGPDWPTCNGYIVPPNLFDDQKVFLEYTHRLVTLPTSALIFAAAFLAWRNYRTERALLFWTMLTLALLVSQVILGFLVVTFELHWIITASHTAVATATFGSAAVLAVISTKVRK